jgi:hypothetical protein
MVSKEEHRFSATRYLGHGRVSEVYAAYSETFRREVCLKREPYKDAAQLVNEHQMLSVLDGLSGVSRPLLYGFDGENYVLVTDVVGMCFSHLIFHTTFCWASVTVQL